MKKILILIAMLFSFQHLLFSQDQHLIDSLQTLLKTAKQDTNKANILYQLSKSYWSNNPDKAMDYAKQTLALSEKINYKKGIGNSYNSMGYIIMVKGDCLPALDLFKKSLKIREEISDKQGIAGSCNNIGTIYLYYKYNYPEALKYFTAALKINEETRNKNWQAINYLNIGRIYHRQENYPEALKNLIAALKINEELGDKHGIADVRTSMGIIYIKQRNYPEALINLFAALKICEEIRSKIGIASNYMNIGIIYQNQGNYPEALKSQFTALKIHEDIGNKNGVAGSCVNIGTTYISQKKYKDASEYLYKSLSLSKEIGSMEVIKECYSGLAKLDSAQGNFKLSLEHYKLYIATRDSMFNMEKTKKIMQIEVDNKEALAKAEQENKDALAQKKLQRQKLVRNGFIGGFVVVMLFAFVFLRQRNKISKAKKISEEERKKAEEERKKAEAEKKRSEELLLNILPAEVATELKQTGHCQAKTFSMVTVMFMDFKDFTSVSERVSAELLVDEINSCFSAFDLIIQKYRVEKIKTVGDAYICAGGLPVLNQTHARDIVHAAIEIQGFMLARKIEKEAKDEFFFDMRVGIHTGPVVAGIVGVKKFQYDIWGDTVNLAARMEQNSEAGKINISGSTYKLVKDKFTCSYRGKIEAKNKGEVEMYFVEAQTS
jgi:adenylate cyclase